MIRTIVIDEQNAIIEKEEQKLTELLASIQTNFNLR